MAVDSDENYVKNGSLSALFQGQSVPATNTIDSIANLANKNLCDMEINAFLRHTTYIQFTPSTNLADTNGDLGLAAIKLYAMILDGKDPDWYKLPKGLRMRIKNRNKNPAFATFNPITQQTGE